MKPPREALRKQNPKGFGTPICQLTSTLVRAVDVHKATSSTGQEQHEEDKVMRAYHGCRWQVLGAGFFPINSDLR